MNYFRSIIFLFLFIPCVSQAQEYPVYTLDVTLDVAASAITGVSKIEVTAGQKVKIRRGTLRINSATFNDKPLQADRNTANIEFTPAYDGVAEIHFEGTFKNSSSSPDNPGVAGNFIGKEGVSLTGAWYPVIDGLASYKLKASLPAGYEAISEAEEISKEITRDSVEFSFQFEHPLDSINLVASDKYVPLKDTYKEVGIHAYFFEEDIGIAKTYMEFTKKYLELYEGLIGEYPYKRFSIVENFLPTGYSMPTYTLLGRSVVNLPFIVKTSLGHEILHQWFGNSVYIDFESGNWAEGLTTYLADHLYKTQEQKGWEYRKQILIDYRSYVTPEVEFPLSDFRSRVDRPSRAIGYGKTAMVFHMLKNRKDDDLFFDALKHFIHKNRYRAASWSDLESSFEKIYEEDLQWFFSQWVNRAGMPEFRLYGFELTRPERTFKLHFHLEQKGDVFQFILPATIYLDDNTIQEHLAVNSSDHSFDIQLPQKPGKIVFDENYDVSRIIDKKEFPPVMARLIGHKSPLLVLPPKKSDIYKPVTKKYREEGAEIKKPDDIKTEDLKSSSALILGMDNPLIKRLYGNVTCEKAGFCMVIKENPWNSDHVIGIMSGTSKDEVNAAFRKIVHYGKYTKLLFENGRNTVKEIKPSQRGLHVELKPETPVIDISALKGIADVIEEVRDKKIIYVGEVHDVFAHHAVQLDIITAIFERDRNIAIGLEMFQVPFQQSLDRFIDGKMGEREFLKESEYFKRWGFDYNLYKPILDFARAECIHVVALNTKREIIQKVSKSGIDSLSPEEKKEIPADLDFSDDKYRSRLEEIFTLHENSDEKNFDYFYQSQILWDETMSMSIDKHLATYPEQKMVVLAGQGHLMYGSGIPKRTFRRNGYEYSIILIDADVDADIADYIFFPKPVEGITSPMLMVFLLKGDDGFAITGFPDNSVSEKAGIKAGDILLYVDDVKVDTIDDIKIRLLYKKKGDIINVTVQREENGKKEEIKIEVVL
jgi:uncharacterized iron-regulated protein